MKPIRHVVVEVCPTCPLSDNEGRCDIAHRQWTGSGGKLPPSWCPLRTHSILVSLVEKPRAALDEAKPERMPPQPEVIL